MCSKCEAPLATDAVKCDCKREFDASPEERQSSLATWQRMHDTAIAMLNQVIARANAVTEATINDNTPIRSQDPYTYTQPKQSRDDPQDSKIPIRTSSIPFPLDFAGHHRSSPHRLCVLTFTLTIQFFFDNSLHPTKKNHIVRPKNRVYEHPKE